MKESSIPVTKKAPLSQLGRKLEYTYKVADIKKEWQENTGQIKISDEEKKILDFCLSPRKFIEIQSIMGWANKTKFRNKFINPLLAKGLLAMTIPNIPKSRAQKYQTTDSGKAALKTHVTI